MTDDELEYCMMRAREEAHRALRSNSPETAAAHQRLSVRYSARAFLLRAAENDDMGTAHIVEQPRIHA